MNIGKFKVVNLPNGHTRFVAKGFGEIDFNRLTEHQAEQLYHLGCPYLELAEKPKAKAKTATKEETQKEE